MLCSGMYNKTRAKKTVTGNIAPQRRYRAELATQIPAPIDI
jgi:hypothetical protein